MTWRRTALLLANLNESIKLMARRGLKDRVGRDVEAEFDERDEIDFLQVPHGRHLPRFLRAIG